jgi:hypothetical protein
MSKTYNVIFIGNESDEVRPDRFVKVDAASRLEAMEAAQRFLDGCAMFGAEPVVIAAMDA